MHSCILNQEQSLILHLRAFSRAESSLCGLVLECIVYLSLDPIAALWLVPLDQRVVANHKYMLEIGSSSLHKSTEVLKAVEVPEKLGHIVGDFLLTLALDLELLFVELAEAVNTATNVFVVEEGAGVVVMSELNQEDCVTLV